jgi:predicted nucleic acid-binding protein
VITYVDTSTLIKLLIEEPGSDRAARIWEAADAVVSVSLIEVEARAALAAAERTGRMTAAEHRRAKRALADLLAQLDIVEVTSALVTTASELAEDAALRGYDAVHLAGAIEVGADVFSTADADLAAAAELRGLAVANPIAAE